MKGYWSELNILDKILYFVFKRYTYKIYRKGIRDGFNWENIGERENKVNHLSTVCQPYINYNKIK